jgi:serine protease Do
MEGYCAAPAAFPPHLPHDDENTAMTNLRRLTLTRCAPRLSLALLLALSGTLPLRGEAVPTALDKPVPENLQDLRQIQNRVQRVLAKVVPCTVGVQIGGGSGSGVIVSKDGHVLTAGHVAGIPDRPVTLILSDGRKIKGKTLGANHGADSGMIQITDKGVWPFAEMGDASKLKKGQWCLTLGHPGGFRPGRTPPVRLGRILSTGGPFLRTTCTLVGGDSGGPLFDLDGKVIGIHSRIGGPITANMHVPVNTYRTTWDRLVEGEVWGGRNIGPYIGFHFDQEAKGCKVLRIDRGSPAEKAGLKPKDIVTGLDKQKVSHRAHLQRLLRKHKAGEKVTLEIQRGDKVLTVEAVLGTRQAGSRRRPAPSK